MKIDWKKSLKKLLEKGASYADVRYFPQEDSSILYMLNGNLLEFNQLQDQGFGVRVLYEGAWGFAASSDPAQAGHTFEMALKNARTAARKVKRPVVLADKDAVGGEFVSPCAEDPFEVEIGEQMAMLQWLDGKLNQRSVTVRYVQTNRKTIEYYDTGAKSYHHIYPRVAVMV